VSLPNPLPDNPHRWDGWRSYNSANFYERLGLTFDSNASNEQIEDNCRQLLVWWQKKLPLKNQPSNPLSQILRAGLDDAPIYLVEARSALLDVETRRKHDLDLRAQAVAAAVEEFKKLILFAFVDGKLLPDDEERLLQAGLNLGLSREEAAAAIDVQIAQSGATRAARPASAPPSNASSSAAPVATPGEPFSEFRRLLRMSRLSLDGEDMTDDQRDAMCNLGESLGLTGGQAEDLIDEYLEETSSMPVQAAPVRAVTALKPAAPRPNITATAKPPPPKPAAVAAAPKPVAAPKPAAAPAITPLIRAQEREKYPNFPNMLGVEMLLVTSGSFGLGSAAPDAQPGEQPVTPTNISRFYLSRFQITNLQYERFDPTHTAKRAPWADEHHPAVYVTALDAEKFCEWLSRVEGRRYRLPTEAEWEYAARGLDGRAYPWGEHLDEGFYANFADARSNFTWRESRLDDGWAQTSPVGAYPKGAGPFGIEDLAGNVFEWCLDGHEPYKGKEQTNPRGPRTGTRRVYRGGSWKSRANSLRATARAFNDPSFSSNDVGFRILCECD
jgi:formylglycine-generating enzyme required for sulfatase activity